MVDIELSEQTISPVMSEYKHQKSKSKAFVDILANFFIHVK